MQNLKWKSKGYTITIVPGHVGRQPQSVVCPLLPKKYIRHVSLNTKQWWNGSSRKHFSLFTGHSKGSTSNVANFYGSYFILRWGTLGTLCNPGEDCCRSQFICASTLASPQQYSSSNNEQPLILQSVRKKGFKTLKVYTDWLRKMNLKLADPLKNGTNTMH